MNKLKIGFLIDDLNTSWYVDDLVKYFIQHNNVEIKLLIIDNNIHKKNFLNKIFALLKVGKFKSILDALLFKIILLIEKLILNLKYNNKKKNLDKFNLKNYKINNLIVIPQYSNNNLIKIYNDKDIDEIKKSKLDLIIRGGSGILKGKILKASKFGIISLHHGDNIINRGGPPGFWEVYFKKPNSGFIIQILNEFLDNGKILYRGNFRTEQFYLLNEITIKERSNFYLKKIIENIAINNDLPNTINSTPFFDKIYKKPSYIESCIFILKIFFRILIKLITKIFFREIWNVKFSYNNFNEITFQNSIALDNPKGSFLADPFIWEHKEKKYIFMENFYFKKNKGVITAYEINNKKFKNLGIVLEEKFHLSFPFLFKFENEIFMVPETNKINEIRLYKCLEFPMKWQYYKTLIKNIKASDTVIFEYNKKWWMFTNFSPTFHDRDSELNIFYTNENPLSENWISHKNNPIILNPNKARNAGIFFSHNRFYRNNQSHNFDNYGDNLDINIIEKLNDEEYVEKEIFTTKNKLRSKKFKFHHLDQKNNFTVFDYSKKKLKIFL